MERTWREKFVRLIQIRFGDAEFGKIALGSQDNSPQARITDSSSTNAVSLSSAREDSLLFGAWFTSCALNRSLFARNILTVRLQGRAFSTSQPFIRRQRQTHTRTRKATNEGSVSYQHQKLRVILQILDKHLAVPSSINVVVTKYFS